MCKIIRLTGGTFILVAVILAIHSAVLATEFNRQWASPFSIQSPTNIASDTLNFEQVLARVGQANDLLQSTRILREGVSGLIGQAGLRPNPELEFEIEGISGDLPGLSESEWSLSLSQELELWSKRGARIEAARAESLAINNQSLATEFDIYIKTRQQFARLLHAQSQYDLIQRGYDLAEEMTEASRKKVNKGAALISEFHLAELESARLKIDLHSAQTNLIGAKSSLASLWGGNSDDFTGVNSENYQTDIVDIERLIVLIDDSREIRQLEVEQILTEAEAALIRIDQRPNPTLSAGYRRLQGAKVNTILFGISLPLPVFNRNQGNLSVLQSDLRARESQIRQIRREIEADIIFGHKRLSQLKSKLISLAEEIIPKAKTTFKALKDGFDAGKMPYTVLLEAERTLLGLQQEFADTRLEYEYQVIDLESRLGIRFGPSQSNEVTP